MQRETPVLTWTAAAVGVILVCFCLGYFVLGPSARPGSATIEAVESPGPTPLASPPPAASSVIVEERTDEVEAKRKKAEEAAKKKADAEAQKLADAAAKQKAADEAAKKSRRACFRHQSIA